MSDHFYTILIDDRTLDEFMKVVKVIGPDDLLKLTYDTTFKFGQMHCSILALRHPLLERVHKTKHTVDSTPIFPFAYLLHERRPQIVHHRFFFELNARLRLQLSKKDFLKFTNLTKVLISDREFTEDYLPNMVHAYCWRHIRQNMKWKLVKLMKKEDSFTASSAVHKIMELMKVETREEYEVSYSSYDS